MMVAKRKLERLTFVEPMYSDSQMAAYINEQHGAAMQAGAASINHAKEYLIHVCRAGSALFDMKERLRHGSFMTWVEQNCAFSHNTAIRYMAKAKEAHDAVCNQDKITTVVNLEPGKAIALLSNEPASQDHESPSAPPEAAPEADPEAQTDLFSPAESDERSASPPAPTASADAASTTTEQPSSPPKPAAPHPHSDRLVKWLQHVASETHVINVKMGGIKPLLAEPDKWDWRDVREYIIPQMDDLIVTIREFQREIQKHANDQMPS
jgi:hypothetical protein